MAEISHAPKTLNRGVRRPPAALVVTAQDCRGPLRPCLESLGISVLAVHNCRETRQLLQDNPGIELVNHRHNSFRWELERYSQVLGGSGSGGDPYAKKFLVIMPVHMTDPSVTLGQCQNIMGRLLSPTDFEVVLLRGTGDRPNENTDIEIVRTALRKLGWEGVVQAVLRGT